MCSDSMFPDNDNMPSSRTTPGYWHKQYLEAQRKALFFEQLAKSLQKELEIQRETNRLHASMSLVQQDTQRYLMARLDLL